MPPVSFDLSSCPAELQPGLRALTEWRPTRFGGRGALPVTFARADFPGGAGLEVTLQDGGALVRYARKCDAFRALGGLLGADERTDAACGGREIPRLTTLGVMVDASRNGVLRPDAARDMLCRLALMGINMFMLYCEDTYEVPGEPYFGYLRGRYTGNELRGIDDHAHALGIEVVPCIQTLGHLEQVLQWPPYAGLRDARGVILAEDDRTYELLEKMIRAATSPLRSRRIHVGMDETWGLATGRYRELHGERRPFDVFNAHLARVRDICGGLGLSPMIWADMYFEMGSAAGSHYDLDSVVPDDVAAGIPRDVTLVYWDYYHCEPEFYESMIDKYRVLGAEPVVAGGVWTWDRLWAALRFSLAATDACMKACKARGVREAFVTLWGDDGMECDVFSALPGVQFFAEHGYRDEVDAQRLRAGFRGSCAAEFDDWVRAGDVDVLPGAAEPERCHPNAGKWLLWQDPALSVLDPLVDAGRAREHYAALAGELAVAARRGPEARRLRFAAQIARTLAVKCGLRARLAEAVRRGDRGALATLLDGDVRTLRREVRRLWRVHRDLWHATYKPFGWEVVERRYGGLMARIDTLADRVRAYVKGDLDALPELEADLLEQPDEDAHRSVIGYMRAATPSCIK